MATLTINGKTYTYKGDNALRDALSDSIMFGSGVVTVLQGEDKDLLMERLAEAASGCC